MKLLSIAVPCYNSEAYMEKCVGTLLKGGEEVEILIVDDGSRDRTAEIADRLEQEHPGIVRALHQPNKGHGGAVNTGIENASGLYFKVVDSDDWVGEEAYREVLNTLRKYSKEEQLDLLLSNFVYNKENENQHKTMQYRSMIPAGRLLGWEDVKRFRKGHYVLMHSVIYRTQMLRDAGLKLPEHCFYVDNYYVFQPLPYVEKLYYLDVDFYYYYIGRADQSVNEKIMISRLDQQARVNRLMVDYFSAPENQERINAHRSCRSCMFNYLEIITTITCILALCSNTPEHLKLRDDNWAYIRSRDENLYKELRYGIFGRGISLPGKAGRKIVLGGYAIARKLFHFN